jgi:uncharacterized membrane protein YkvI
MSTNSLFSRWFLPGFVFQSVIIGGGYATGRELVEFFLSSGPLAGLVSMLVVTVVFSVCMALSFELARLYHAYDYRTFLKQLIGPGWILFEILWAILVVLVLAVLGAASGELVSARLGWPPVVGTVLMLTLIGFLVFWGSALIEKALAGWSFLLYAVYTVLIVSYLWQFGDRIPATLAADDMSGPWVLNTFRFTGYTLTAIPMILFCTRHLKTRKDAFIAGAIAGPIGFIPGIMFYIGMVANYPEILDVPVPADYMMQGLGFVWIAVVFYIVVFGTFVETGTGLIHAINERIAHVFVEHALHMPRWLRPVIALALLLTSILLARYFGIIDLIAKGYGSMAWAFLAIMFIPLVTVGVWRIAKAPPQ